VESWQDYFSLLKCLECGKDLTLSRSPKIFAGYSMVSGELTCSGCDKAYPLLDDVPVMFRDEERTRILVDPGKQPELLKSAEDAMRQAETLTGKELAKVKREGQADVDALAWELLFWENWKGPDRNWHILNEENIEEFLSRDTDNGGRLRFLDRIVSFDGSLPRKRLLNIGAGKDFILERLLRQGFEVVEQDIVLESLLLLKKRGASFCVCCDARHLPFKDNSFDVSTSLGVLHHIWPIEEPTSELLRVTSGNIHFNEPNSHALVRAALILPGFIKQRLKRMHSGSGSHSPYEEPINPRIFRRIAKRLGARITDYCLPKSSWIGPDAKGLKKFLRTIDLFAVNIFPVLSSHFDMAIRKRE
jgi:uncharacterized protein YbaR (Trm112 family)/SAM-dependent methyltransferase